jgi:putative inorganic carbon (HCO3(-)) transporter
VVMVALVVGLFLVMSRMSGSLSQRANTLSSLERDQSFQWRLGMWSKALRMTRDRPLMGWGIGSFPLQQALYYHPEAASRSQRSILRTGPTLQENAHNSYLQLAAEIGIPGLLLYLALLCTFFVTGLRALPHLDPGPRQGILMGALAGIAGQMVCAVGNPSWEFPECSAFFWLVLAIGMAAAGVPSRGMRRPGGGQARLQLHAKP